MIYREALIMKYMLMLVCSLMVSSGICADNRTEIRWGYQYDALNRLTNAWCSNGFRETYAYDAVGNRIRCQTFGPPTIDPISNRVVVAGQKLLVPFAVHHVLIPISNIVVTADTVDASVISSNSLSVVGLGTNRVLMINTASPVSGRTAHIKLIASDGYVSSSRMFTVSLEKETVQAK